MKKNTEVELFENSNRIIKQSEKVREIGITNFTKSVIDILNSIYKLENTKDEKNIEECTQVNDKILKKIDLLINKIDSFNKNSISSKSLKKQLNYHKERIQSTKNKILSRPMLIFCSLFSFISINLKNKLEAHSRALKEIPIKYINEKFTKLHINKIIDEELSKKNKILNGKDNKLELVYSKNKADEELIYDKENKLKSRFSSGVKK
jgi:hypothetical protein